MNSPFKVVIPARYASTRLPGKLLQEIDGKPLLQHVFESASASRASQVVIATDDERIRSAAEAFGSRVIMTSPQHKSGTDRIAEAVVIMNEGDDSIIVNVQGDEYGLPPTIIDQLADELHRNPDKHMATLCENISGWEQLSNPHVVKVIMDRNNSAIYFSRSVIPWCGETGATAIADLPYQPYRHIGVYAYQAAFLKTYTSLPHCPLEDVEKLEQLRVLYHGFKIHVEQACTETGLEVNTREDLEKARQKTATSNKL